MVIRRLPWHLTIAMLLAVGSPAFAAPRIAEVIMGFDGRMPANRACGVTVEIEPGETVTQGSIDLRYSFDGTVIEQRTAPFVTTPGIRSRVPLLFTPHAREFWSSGSYALTLTLRSEKGRALERYVYSSEPSGNELSLPSASESATTTVLVCGNLPRGLLDYVPDETGTRDHWDTESAHPSDQEEFSEAQLRRMYDSATTLWCAPRSLPLLAEAYEGIDAAIVDSCVIEDLDAMQLDAIQQWVERGGPLFLVLDCLDERHTDLFEELGALMSPEKRGALKHVSEAPLGGWLPGSVRGVPTRVMDYGFGRVVLLDRENIELQGVMNEEPFWLDLIGQAAARERGSSPDSYGGNLRASWPGSQLFEGVVSMRGNIPVPPFWPLAVSLLLLGFLIGPVLAMLIRRKAVARFNWIMTVAILMVASAASWVFPLLVRTESSWTSVATLSDVVYESGSSAAVCQTSLLLFGAGASGRYDVDPSARGHWRTVHSPHGRLTAARSNIIRDRSGDVLESIRAPVWTIEPFLFESFQSSAPQSLATGDQDDLSAERSGSDGSNNLPIVEVFMIGDDRLEATVRTPEGHSSFGAQIVHRSIGVVPLLVSNDGSGWSLSQPIDPSETAPGIADAQWALISEDRVNSYWYYGGDGQHRLSYASFAGVPSVARRARMMSMKLNEGTHALVLLRVQNSEPTVFIEGVDDRTEEEFYRILVPVTHTEKEPKP